MAPLRADEDKTLYDRDFYAWTCEQSRLLRAGRLAEADVENIAEEIETLGRNEKRELVRQLCALLLQLVKWQHQPGHRSDGWRSTIRIQRLDLHKHMTESPSLMPEVPEALSYAYSSAVTLAVAETGLLEGTFVAICPWSFERVISDGFWPDCASGT